MCQFELWVPGRPTPKGRPRFTRSGGVYTPTETKLAEEEIVLAYIGNEGHKFEGSVGLDVEFGVQGTKIVVTNEEWSSPLRGDIDNYLKTVLDGLGGVAFENDRQVVSIKARKL